MFNQGAKLTDDDHRQLRMTVDDKELPLRVFKTQNGRARRQGLLKTDALPDDCALLLPAAPIVHMIGMKYPLELIFITRRGRVAKIKIVRPGIRFSCALAAWSCLEAPVGTAARLGIDKGDILKFQEL